jgi:hypothetical protein
MSADQVITEARARIIWGESPSSVHDFLTSNGVTDADADAKLAEFALERNRELRSIGLRDLLIGIVLVSAAGITLYFAFLPFALAGSGLFKGLTLVVIALLYGLWKLITGIRHLVRRNPITNPYPTLPSRMI